MIDNCLTIALIINNWQITPGLGKSEVFYSSLIASFNIGSLLPPIIIAILDLLSVPIWYMWFSSILAFVIGFVIRGVTYIPVLIGVSSFLAGYYSGGHYASLYIYFAKSTLEYETYLRAESDEEASKRGSSIRNYLFGTIVVFVSLGQIFSNGKFLASYVLHENYNS